MKNGFTPAFSLRYFLFLTALFLLLTGCSSYGVIKNQPNGPATDSYSLKKALKTNNTHDISLLLAFSGGGTRAAALAYGVLQELRDTEVVINGKQQRLLDQVDIISSVSGGSFTSAYYGLYGDRIFEDYEDVFLRQNIQASLVHGLFNPMLWFSSRGRTELAIKYYEKKVFKGATFADLNRDNSPVILINATDLGNGVRFSFIQEYFNLLCSDVNSFPVARAVTASSAVPVLFNPVVLKNYSHCKHTYPDWLTRAIRRSKNDPELTQVAEALESYFNSSERPFAHFVDGGITDNLGLRAFYEIIEIAGGVREFRDSYGFSTPKQLVIISVNAATAPKNPIESTDKIPAISATVNAMSDIQLHRYNSATLKLIKEKINQWAKQLSIPGKKTQAYFIQVNFSAIDKPNVLNYFNNIPTSFSLTDKQVDELIVAGRKILRNNEQFKQFLHDIPSGN